MVAMTDDVNQNPAKPPSQDAPTEAGDITPWWAQSTAPRGDTSNAEPTTAIPGAGEPPTTTTSAPAATPRWKRRTAASVAVVAIALGSGTAGAVISRGLDSPPATTSASAPAAPVSLRATVTGPTEPLAKVAAAVQPSVVSITVDAQSGSGEGSGIILRSDGTILTNNHVVADAADGGGTLTVKLSDGRTAKATIVGRDPSSDLAVIRATGLSGLTPATLGTTNTLHVGDTVLAIGSPLGLDGSVTAGIVSALHRQVQLGGSSQSDPFGGSNSSTQASVSSAIQTDAAVNPGNSGGALVDAQGRVVGINSAIATLGSSSGQSGSIGLGFAIPIDDAKTVVDALLAGRTVSRAQLGVSVGDSPDGGALVASVTPDSAAAKAGLKEADVITSFGGTAIQGASDLTTAVRAHKPGDKVSLTYTRSGTKATLTVTLGSSNPT